MEENKENVVEETTQVTEKVTTDDNVTKVNLKTFQKQDLDVDDVTKVDLSKPIEKPIEEIVEGVVEEIVEEVVDKPVVEEVAKEVAEAVPEVKMPDNVDKLITFINETGGNLLDYVNLNKNYDDEDDSIVLEEFYKKTKPHLTNEDINFMLEDRFSYDEDVDEEKDINRKKLALKEQVADAKSHLDGLKSKYYEDVKAGSSLTNEQQKAVDFFNRYDQESKEAQQMAEKQKTTFLDKTDEVFNNEFKGFEYNVGDKKFRFNVNNAGEVRDSQADINNFVKKFLNKNEEMSDAKGYHKSLYTAMNPDAIANHFYEQGKTDALKASVESAKNINVGSRKSHQESTVGGFKFKVVGENSNDFKVKIKNK